ncbi:MAG: exodeoxyribonuclease VII large subunit [Bacteroidaceae bacterium]|nr:exodeoxyribonuclease VII large subunit [Bacteroidaceae bacterium]
MNSLTLFELNQLVRRTLEHFLRDTYWLQAELSEVSESRGHCYLEFIQKDQSDGRLIAKARGQIWRNRWDFIRPYFQQQTGSVLSAGMQVLVQVQVTFHELYGYSLNVLDVDPTYTLGDMARRRQEILNKLRDQGIDQMNKELPLPLCLQRIAIISSHTAAGYGDFCNQLQSNPDNLVFYAKLFPAVMQGEGVEQSIIQALNEIAATQEQWDVVVIIRGGGSTADLSGFDTLSLAENVAQFPLPIITGIGHERDDTIIDLVAHTRVKTPTAAAELLIHHQTEQLNRVLQYSERIHTASTALLKQASVQLQTYTLRLPSWVATTENQQRTRIDRLTHTLQNTAFQHLARCRSTHDILDHRLHAAARQMLQQQHTTLDIHQHRIQAADPHHVLQFGYSITRLNGKALKDAEEPHPGDILETILFNGKITSVVKMKLKGS